MPEVDIPLALPLAVAASEDYIYVNDMVSNRMARVRMNYALDNIPGLTEHPEGLARAGKHSQRIALCSSPNPFNPLSRVTLTLSARSAIRLCVYDLSGRLVRALCSASLPSGTHDFVWDAKNGAGKQVSAGIYVYRLEAAGKVLYRKTILAK